MFKYLVRREGLVQHCDPRHPRLGGLLGLLDDLLVLGSHAECLCASRSTLLAVIVGGGGVGCMISCWLGYEER
eukprot:SAG25_NODE_260_length_10806_cov_39.327356_2_plen_73_part_00